MAREYSRRPRIPKTTPPKTKAATKRNFFSSPLSKRSVEALSRKLSSKSIALKSVLTARSSSWIVFLRMKGFLLK